MRCLRRVHWHGAAGHALLQPLLVPCDLLDLTHSAPLPSRPTLAVAHGRYSGGRILVRPLYKKISEFANAEIFAATTLLMVLGTSFLTQLAGLSLALGAFLAGLLIAETEYALQVGQAAGVAQGPVCVCVWVGGGQAKHGCMPPLCVRA
jgi:hypothetical protein